ncbi:hypothetical protein [Metallibacterium sp.]|uniref:hypothetical protein n=1 Tax=Metallibacterium sp. TaxID=2940281 RepID=UPI002624E2A9|nr:hypothetical protein [Metallibacterium sp.]
MTQRSLRRRAQTVYAVLGVLALLGLRLASAWSLRVDSDEPQHLHVVWAWTQGLLPYVDLFDNHTPLFQLLMSPLLALLGARADIVPCMRTATIPVWTLGLALTWWLGRRLWNARVGWVAATLTALFPLTYLSSVQFRTDDLWWVLWVAGVAVAALGAPDRRRLAAAGLLIGLSFAVSMKTTPLLITQLLALGLLGVLWHWQGRAIAWCTWLGALPGALLGLLLPLAAFAAFFAAQGALGRAWYFWIGYNIVPGMGPWTGSRLQYLLFPTVSVLVALVSWRRLRVSTDAVLTLRRLAMFDGAALYLAALLSYWPLLTLQDLLPVVPLLMLGASGTRLVHTRRIGWGFRLALALELLTILAVRPPWRDRLLQRQERELALVLRLTHPDDFVMDAKGEAIFRRRPVFWVFEDIAEYRIAHGLLHPQVRVHLERTGTPVVIDHRMPDSAEPFIARNYLPLQGNVRVLGQRFTVAQARQPVLLPIAIPQRYVLLDAQGRSAAARIDGRAVTGAVALTRGCHTLEVPAAGPYLLLWAPAIRRGLDAAALLALPAQRQAAPAATAEAALQCRQLGATGVLD